MGYLKEFIEWLKGNDGGKNNTTTMIVKLKIFTRKLERQSTKLNNQSNIIKRKAVDLRKKGDMNSSKVQMRASLQNKKWALGVDNFALQMHTLQFKLEQAKMIEDVGQIFQGIATNIAGLQNTVNSLKISGLMEQIDLGIQDFDVTQEITQDGFEAMNVSTEVSDEEVENALSEVDAEISVETGEALPSPKDERISELEKELKRLK